MKRFFEIIRINSFEDILEILFTMSVVVLFATIISMLWIDACDYTFIAKVIITELIIAVSFGLGLMVCIVKQW